jgi:predicted esterase
MIQKNITVTKTARYFIQGEVSENIEQVWFVCHGYGELAFYFSKKFEALKNDKTLIVAPEALNRFYRNGFTGKVGASWMTSEERSTEISDYINYLNAVYSEILSALKNKKVKINILGFSQASATVCRWVANGMVNPDNLIIWAGFFPHDTDYENTRNLFIKANAQIVIGKNDEFYTSEKIQEHMDLLKEKGVQCKLTLFEGGHEIHLPTLQALVLN